MGNSLLCHYTDNCFKKGIILWGQKHCDWGGKVEEWGAFAPPVTMLKKALIQRASSLMRTVFGSIDNLLKSISITNIRLHVGIKILEAHTTYFRICKTSIFSSCLLTCFLTL